MNKEMIASYAGSEYDDLHSNSESICNVIFRYSSQWSSEIFYFVFTKYCITVTIGDHVES